MSYPLARPAIVGGVVYIGGDHLVAALRADSGAVLWQARGIDDDILVAPVVDGGIVYTEGVTTLYALATSDGAPRWQAPIGSPNDSTDATLVASGGVLYTADGLGSVTAYRGADGTTLWGSHVNNSAFALAVEQGSVVVVTQLHVIYALDASDGSLRWQQPIDTFATWGDPPPFLVANGIAYVGTERGVVLALRVGDGSQRWRDAITPKPIIPEPTYLQWVTFNATIPFEQALQTVTDLGLQEIAPCDFAGSRWQPQTRAPYWSASNTRYDRERDADCAARLGRRSSRPPQASAR